MDEHRVRMTMIAALNLYKQEYWETFEAREDWPELFVDAEPLTVEEVDSVIEGLKDD